ncbi:MAG: restriction endonuclease subunit S [Bacteroidales bacterium]|jgi:type I restriction enzyme S subunit|nr:restriction endonuclease subunit S [Bacteroidales bacterium]
MAWKKEKFKTLIEHKSGYTWSKEQETKFPEPKTVRVLTVTNVQKELDLSSELYLKDVSEADKVKKAVSKDWSIAVSSNGNRSRIGNAVYIKEDSEYLFASFLTAFKPKEDSDILPDYFFRWLTSHNIQERITAVSEGTTGLGNLDIRFLRNTEIEYPENPAEQTAIAIILSKVDEAIAATQNSIKAAEKLKKALMQNLLTGKLKPDGSWRTDDEFYVDEKFGKVPKGWEVKKLKDVCVGGGQYGANASAIDYTEGNPRYIRITDIDDYGNLIEENKAGIEKNKVKEYLLKENDFLFARTGDTVGKSLLYKEEMGLSAYAGYLIKFTFNENLILPEYFNLIAKSDIFEAFKIAMQRVGAKPNINSREYGSFRFPLSNNINVQQSIYEKAKPIDESISKKQTKIRTLQRLKKSLMQQLLTGKVRLPQEVIDRLAKEDKEVLE